VTTPQFSSWYTSNDLLRRLVARYVSVDPNHQTDGQSTEEVQENENAPTISMGPYLHESGQLTGTGADGVRYCFKVVRPTTLSE